MSGRRTAIVIYLVIAGINLLVLPNWFSPGRFPFSSRVAFAAVNIMLVAFCAWKLAGLLGGNPFRRRRRSTYTIVPEEDDDDLDLSERRRQRVADWAAMEDEEDPTPDLDQAPDADATPPQGIPRIPAPEETPHENGTGEDGAGEDGRATRAP